MLSDLRKILDSWSIRDATIVVATSGGPDSIALLAALAELRPGTVVAVHVNHGLRGTDSDEDASFVEETARRLGVACRIVNAPPDDRAVAERGIEAAARESRYDALHRVGRDVNAAWIATGHTIDDQAETVLLRLITNASIESLAGIRPQTDDGVIRPLLGVRRSSLRTFLHERGLGYRTDATNLETRFLRNRVRLELLPELEKRDERVVDRLAAIADHVRSIRQRITPSLEKFAEMWDRDPTRSTIDVPRLPAPGDLRRLVLSRELRRLSPRGRAISSERLEDLVEELREGSPASLGDGLVADLQGDRLVLATEPVATAPFHVSLTAGETKTIHAIGASVTIERVSEADELTDQKRLRQAFTLPPDVELPVTFEVRNRRPGDRFQPLGLGGSKKLKEVLIDRKVPSALRDQIPLLLVGDEIVWIAGIEVSERFRVIPGRALYEVRIDYGHSDVPESI